MKEDNIESPIINAKAIEDAFVSSRYNFHVPIGDDVVLLYNANTGAVLRLNGVDALELGQALCGGVVELTETILPQLLFGQLVANGFIVPSGTDELAIIRRRYTQARGETPLVVTLTSTMDCNLGCYYCYEARSTDRLETQHISAIESWITERLHSRADKSLHIDWYGGEPMLNVDFIETASLALQRLCERERAPYSASIISNGTAWPDDAGNFVNRHKIRQVQISFDGLSENHNLRRRYRRGFSPGTGASSFDLTVALVDKLLDFTRVDVRLNLDQRNQGDLIPFVELARGRGWFARRFPAVIQPARLAAYSERSAFMRDDEMSAVEYDILRAKLRNYANNQIRIEESEAPDGFPFPRTSVCAALARQSFVVGADGLEYRCGLQVGEKHRAVGRVTTEAAKDMLEVYPDAEWWNTFDPTVLPNCSRCSFLPVCWGGCPKKHLDGDNHALDEQGQYWRTNLPRLIATRFGLQPLAGFFYTEDDQFR